MTRTQLIAIIVVALCLGLAAAASAATATYTASVPETYGSWNTTLSIPKFNPTLGTLTSISFSMDTDVGGQIGIQNFDPGSGETVDASESCVLTLTRPDTTTIVTATPSAFSGSADLQPWTGVYDTDITTFTGVDAVVFTLSNSASASVVTPPPTTDLALFTSTGASDLDISLPISAVTNDSYDGNGNDQGLFHTWSDANVTVIYTYTAAPPPPCPPPPCGGGGCGGGKGGGGYCGGGGNCGGGGYNQGGCGGGGCNPPKNQPDRRYRGGSGCGGNHGGCGSGGNNNCGGYGGGNNNCGGYGGGGCH